MLLEELAEKAGQCPEFDWDGYYRWLYNQLAGRDVSDVSFWQCKSCLTVNVTYLPARYGKCRCCDLIHLSCDM